MVLHHPRLRPLRRRLRPLRRGLGRLRRGARSQAHRAVTAIPYQVVRRPPSRRTQTGSVRSPAEPGARLVPSPVFVMSSVRSGSTLLRVLLNSHPQICAPHELHLRTLSVQLGKKKYVELAVQALDLDQEELEYLLWDRILHRELQRSGKQIVVDKTPGNAFIWSRLTRCWPEARYIFLLRHPVSMVTSLLRGRPDRDYDHTVNEVYGYAKGVEEARNALPGLTVRYEDLTEDPRRVTQEICRYLGVGWTSDMLNYGEQDHGQFRAGIGDWSKQIRSGRIQKARPLPTADEVPGQLRDITRAWGYLD